MVSGVKLWTVVGSQLRRKEVESFALQQLMQDASGALFC